MERGRTLPVCIVAGNKCDLQSQRQVGAREGLEWARSRQYGFMETSAREMVNIEETFARTYKRLVNLVKETNRSIAVIVRRVVEARRNRNHGIRQELPSSTARTQPLDPLPNANEKGSSPSEEPKKPRWWKRLCC
jgi:GTPase KRas